MCGIFGWDYRKSKVSIEQRSMVAAILAVANDTRGGDSWGFWNTEHLMRGLGDISAVAVKTVKSQVVMAHTRKATTGATTVPNAHPFSIGGIIGAHNGMISNHTELNTKYKRNFEVDSMHLFGHLAEGLPFDDIYGYGAIEFIRKEQRSKVYLCKLSGGDLTVCGIGKDINNYQGVLWSSNGTHLESALKTAGIQFFKFEIKQNQIYSVHGGQLAIHMAEGKPAELELGSRSYSTSNTGHWDQRSHHGYHPNYVRPTPTSGTAGNRTKLTPAEYEAMLEGMTDEEEKAFFELWAKEEGIEFEEIEESDIVEGTKADTATAREPGEDDADWPDEGSVASAPTKEAIAGAVSEMTPDKDAEFDPSTDKWITTAPDGTMGNKLP